MHAPEASPRERLVALLRQRSYIETDAVADAFLAVPREAFVRFVRSDKVYEDIAIITRVNRLGRGTSSSSQPAIMARMLEMLQLRPGMNVLEIGAGTGYNAALLQTLIGDGKVTTIDIQRSVAQEAQERLRDAGYGRVRVIAADGALGCLGSAPYDRMLASVSASDVPVEWWRQLRLGGILVLPLGLRGMGIQVVAALRKTETGFESTAVTGGGFMPLQGSYAWSLAPKAIGPRKDLLISRGHFGAPVDEMKLFQLLNTVPVEVEASDELTLGAPDSDEAQGWQYFLHLQDCIVLSVNARSPVYGFGNASAVVNDANSSVCLIVPQPAVSGSTPKPPKVFTYGDDSARSVLERQIGRYKDRGKPRASDLVLSVLRRSESSPAIEAEREVLTRNWRFAFTFRPRPGPSG